MLIGVAGRGWYQEEGKPAVEILPGTVIHIPANVKHWHGAAADSWFAHLAFEIPGEGSSNEWLEPVNDEAYNKIQNKTGFLCINLYSYYWWSLEWRLPRMPKKTKYETIE